MIKKIKIPEIYEGLGFLEELESKGYKRKDILKAMELCSTESLSEQGDELILFLEGIKYGRKTK